MNHLEDGAQRINVVVGNQQYQSLTFSGTLPCCLNFKNSPVKPLSDMAKAIMRVFTKIA